MIKLSLKEARALTLHYQFNRFENHSGKAGVLDVIKTLSYVQLDTINVIERAHHHTLFNRVSDYKPKMLNELLAKDKTIWEYWAHAASYIPIEDYPFYKHRMQNFPNGSWEKRFWEMHKDLAKPVLNRIKKEGPLSTRHFEDTRKEKGKEIWSNMKPAKIMLELLMWKGDLIVTAREGFQRVYDLTERVISDYKKIEIPSDEKRAEFMILKTLQSHGLATANDIMNHIKLAERTVVSKVLDKLIRKKIVLTAVVGDNKQHYYLLSETPNTISPKPVPNEQVKILSPFDNAVILRSRLELIFAFNYALECYVTPAKRKFGYWNCPVLWRDEMVGMLDPKADRKIKTLLIQTAHINKQTWKDESFQKSLQKALSELAAFNGCNTFIINKINPI